MENEISNFLNNFSIVELIKKYPEANFTLDLKEIHVLLAEGQWDDFPRPHVVEKLASKLIMSIRDYSYYLDHNSDDQDSIVIKDYLVELLNSCATFLHEVEAVPASGNSNLLFSEMIHNKIDEIAAAYPDSKTAIEEMLLALSNGWTDGVHLMPGMFCVGEDIGTDFYSIIKDLGFDTIEPSVNLPYFGLVISR